MRRFSPYLAPLGFFGAATACHVLAVWVMGRVVNLSVAKQLMKWDAAYYLAIAQHGYPSHLPPATHPASSAGFYPLYPWIMRPFLHIGLGDYKAAVGVAVVASAGAVVALWQLARRLCDRGTADRTVALFAFAPGAFVLSMGYSEGVLILFATLALLMLVDRRWELAGVFAALAAVARPNGFSATIACAVAAFFALRADRRDFRALLAPLIGVLGFLVVPLYDLWHLGDAFAYWKTQSRAWHKRFDFGADTVRGIGKVIAHPSRDVNLTFAVLALVVLAAGLVLLFRWRPPPEIIAYTVVNAAIIVGTSNLTSTFRMLLACMPIYIAFGRALRSTYYAYALASSAALFGILAMAASTIYYTP